MATEESMHLAAQAWCTPATSHTVMDADLAVAFAETLDRELARLREQVWVLTAALKHEEPRNYIDTEDMVLMQVQAIRRKQRANYSAGHDRQHEAWEWLGLIATYAAAGRFADAAALCVAAALAP